MQRGSRFLIEDLDNTFTEVKVEQVHHKGLKILVSFPSGGTMWVPAQLLIDPERRDV